MLVRLFYYVRNGWYYTIIRHIVMFRFHEEADGRTKAENLAIAKKMLEDLQGVVPTLISSQVSLAHEEQNPANYDLVLVAEYESMEALEAYRVHPAHQEVGRFMAKVRDLRACIDFEY